MIIVLVSLEKSARRRMKFFNLSTRHRGVEKAQLTGRRGVIAFTLCALPVVIGFVIPTSVLGWHALNHLDEWTNPALIKALLNTLRVATIAALITVFAGLSWSMASACRDLRHQSGCCHHLNRVCRARCCFGGWHFDPTGMV